MIELRTLEEFGMRDNHFEENEQIISRKTIENSIKDGEAYRIIVDEKSRRACY